MNMPDKPSYYAVIPAEVRYSPLPPLAKLLYGEIAALTNNVGFECWAGNEYFSDLYDVHERTIQRLILELKAKGFIDIRIEKNCRFITLRGDKNVAPRVTKMSPLPHSHYNVSTPSISTKRKIDHNKGF